MNLNCLKQFHKCYFTICFSTRHQSNFRRTNKLKLSPAHLRLLLRQVPPHQLMADPHDLQRQDAEQIHQRRHTSSSQHHPRTTGALLTKRDRNPRHFCHLIASLNGPELLTLALAARQLAIFGSWRGVFERVRKWDGDERNGRWNPRRLQGRRLLNINWAVMKAAVWC